MPLKTPSFWYRSAQSAPPMIESLLWPVSLIYGFGARLNLSSSQTYISPIPVLCVGNLVAGGGGKTPTLLALNGIIKRHDLAQNPTFLSRGYGGTESGPYRVTSDHDTVQRVGDEPLLLANTAQTVISRYRPAGIKLAHGLDADMILMDDGYQNPSVTKDISVLVIDGEAGFGNGKLLPAGPLRETVVDGLARADAVVLIGEDKRNITASIPAGRPLFKAHIKSKFKKEPKEKYIAFCGLARPEKFQDTLKAEGLNILAFHAFADHHVFSEAEIAQLSIQAKNENAVLLTTEKDHVRLPAIHRKNIKTFPIEIVFDDEDAVTDFLRNRLTAVRR